MSRRQGRAHFLFKVGDRPQGNRRLEHGLSDFFDAPFADAMTAREVRQRGGQTRANAVGANLLGNRGPCDLAATRANARMSLVLSDLGRQRWQFRHLVTHRRRIVLVSFFRQRPVTMHALLGHVSYRILEPLGREQNLQMRWMAELPTGFLPLGFFGGPLGSAAPGRRGGRVEGPGRFGISSGILVVSWRISHCIERQMSGVAF